MRKLFLILITGILLFSFSLVNAATPKKWTFLVFLNGNNSLDHFGLENILSMEKIGSNDQVNVVVQWASYEKRKTVRMLIQKSKNPRKVTSPIIEDLGLVDMGKAKTLQDFVEWGVKNFPAEHYFVDVWNHGNGWHFKNKKLTSRDISWDDLSGNSIKTEELGQVMTYAAKVIGHKVDIYGSDACLMGMAEVANEMADSVNYFVGSQEVEPGEGWPYADLLSGWERVSYATPEQVAKILVDVYVKSYQGGSNGYADVTFSAYDLKYLPDFNLSLARLSTEVRRLTSADLATVRTAGGDSQSFSSRDYHDVIDFTKNLASKKYKTAIPLKILTGVETAANQLIIANSTTKKYVKAKGLSIWIPTTPFEYDVHAKRYANLQFSQNTKWFKALREILKGMD